MELMTVPVIMMISYLIAEVFKVVFKKKKEMYDLIPVIVSVVGGVLAVLIHITEPTMISDNIWTSLQIGIVSGASATTTNQIIKKATKKEGETNG